ncbi:Alpha/Beta hydrolase protein [Daldinia vernicosa]|uniref:Alpha/Beta hydrolase protein n=1 Tax=Daldinia vernicosa TaxID=114800 RepID=UPI002008A503|nr:Alpha/Beta hydrolase protein [Daldinia vernicosa]KAI0850471.1 Alpha/Beta hydrolase protein [Daldinia vernicosa]
MAQRYGFFQYLRLKFIVTLLRAWVAFGSKEKQQRDRDIVPPEVPKENIRIPSRERGRYIAAHLYLPVGYSDSLPPSKPLPVLVNWHGSGFIFPLLGTDALFCARIARDTGVAVLDTDYRKGPENTFPYALHDAEDVLQWVSTQGHRFDRTRVAVSGFSSGGNIAVVAATALRKQLEDMNIQIILSFYPPVDIAKPPEEKKVPHAINRHPVWMLHLFNDSYAPDVSSRSDPTISPALANLEDFPPTVALITAEGDTLRPEVNDLAERLITGTKKKVINVILDGVPHALDKGCEGGTIEWTQRERSYALATNLLKESLK